jgi:hypothetical protein
VTNNPTNPMLENVRVLAWNPLSTIKYFINIMFAANTIQVGIEKRTGNS